MIVAFSTSSPMASVALIGEGGELSFAEQRLAPRKASEACLEMLKQSGADLSQATAFLADIGPGSFTGVRVGVILAKTFGYLYDRPVGGASAFDLIGLSRTVALPSKRGEYFVRVPGEMPYRTDVLPESAVGYGDAFAEAKTPHASGFASISGLTLVDASHFLPEYMIDPSISTPNTPYRKGER